jgi:hypothetical protein
VGAIERFVNDPLGWGAPPPEYNQFGELVSKVDFNQFGAISCLRSHNRRHRCLNVQDTSLKEEMDPWQRHEMRRQNVDVASRSQPSIMNTNLKLEQKGEFAGCAPGGLCHTAAGYDATPRIIKFGHIAPNYVLH